MEPGARTRIVATAGPALDPPGAIERLVRQGVDVLRVNLSHGSPSAQLARVRRARAVRPELAVLADLGGPKLRLGELAAPVTLRDGEQVGFGPGQLPVADPSFARRVRAGDPVYLVDGTIHLEVVSVDLGADRVECRVLAGGILTSRKGINLPNDQSDTPALTEKDRRDLAELPLLEPDYVALSYVRHERDLELLRGLTAVPLVAKIEKQQALERIEAIIAAADALMVARGDLGVEIPIERVPAAQKRIIRAATRAGKPVITATQMLVSMVSNSLPTRAEVTDVANAVLDGTDAVMLSEETAVGRDPAGVVAMMERILRETEPMLPPGPHPQTEPPTSERSYALACAAVQLAENLGAAALIAATRTGITAQRLAAYRPRLPILAFSKRPETVRRLGLVWGVRAHPLPSGADESAEPLEETLAAARRLLPAGVTVVVLSLGPPGAVPPSSFIRTTTL